MDSFIGIMGILSVAVIGFTVSLGLVGKFCSQA